MTNTITVEIGLVNMHAIATLVVSGPLMYAAVAKLMDSSGFLEALPRFALPLPVRAATAAVIGLLELAVTSAAIIVVRWESVAACGLMYLAFAGIVERARRSGASGDCGCFGAMPSGIDVAASLRNASLGVSALVLAAARGWEVLPPYGVATALGITVTSLLGVALFDTLLSVRAARRR